jgi:hypothetical protein
MTNKSQIPKLNDQNGFGIWEFSHCNLPFDLAQDREPVERLVEPFEI